MPNSSSTAKLVTALTCNTLRNDLDSPRSPIHTPSSHPMATSDRPSGVAMRQYRRYTLPYSTSLLAALPPPDRYIWNIGHSQKGALHVTCPVKLSLSLMTV